VIAAIVVGIAGAATWTDQEDYTPGSTVTISGDNSDGAGYAAGETVRVDVSGPNSWTASCEATTDDNGAWSCQVTIAEGLEAVGLYEYTATGEVSGVSEMGAFTDVFSLKRGSPTATGSPQVFARGETVFAVAHPPGDSYDSVQFELRDPAGALVQTSACIDYTPGTLQSDSYVLPSDAPLSSASGWTYRLKIWVTANATCSGSATVAIDLTFYVAQAYAFATATDRDNCAAEPCSGVATSFAPGATAYVRVLGYIPSVTDVNTAWFKPNGVTLACQNNFGSDRADSDSSGRFSVHYPEPGADNVGGCSATTATELGTWTLRLGFNGQPVSRQVILDGFDVAPTGTLVVNKIVSGGNKAADAFQFDVSGPGPSQSSDVQFEPDGSNSLTVDAGTYTVTEDGANGYAASYDNCAGVVVAGGGTTTCTITNTFVKYDSSTSSTLSSSSVTIGGSVTDSATVWGDADGGDPTGEVKFHLCGPADPSGPYPDCSSGGTLVATDNTLIDAGTDVSSASSGAVTPTAAGKYCLRAEYQGSALYRSSSDHDSSECFIVSAAASAVVFTGQFADADGPPTMLSATVTSSYEPCVSSRQVTFGLDGSTTDYTKTATTVAPSSGSYTRSASTSQTLAYDIYEAAVSVADRDLGGDGIPECSAGLDPANTVLTVAAPGSNAHGGGWYKVDGANPPRVNTGFTVKKQKDGTFKGQILWVNSSKWKLKGMLDGYGVFACPPGDFVTCGVITGTGTLYAWDAVSAAWVDPRAVSFSATLYDGGYTTCAKKNCTKQERPDRFGMLINSLSIPPESDPLQLWGGSIKAGSAT
jgi:hypothetical protein